MMDEILQIERRVIRAGKTVKDLLYHADIDSSLWWKWRNGKALPRRSTVKRLQDAADRLAPKKTG